VKGEWCSADLGNTPLNKWQNKVRHLRQFLHWWARNLSGEYKKEKLLNIINTLDIKAESLPLPRAEREHKKKLMST
jgi:hypothetical protein